MQGLTLDIYIYIVVGSMQGLTLDIYMYGSR